MSFPAPTDYTYEQSLDLNTLIKNVPAAFIFESLGKRWQQLVLDLLQINPLRLQRQLIIVQNGNQITA